MTVFACYLSEIFFPTSTWAFSNAIYSTCSIVSSQQLNNIHILILIIKTGAKVSASDISDAMATEAAARAKSMGVKNAKFYTSDLESVTGKYNTVTCVDVAIHYPTEKMAEMVEHLCSLADERVLISFAPKTWYYELLKKIGELFPGPSKTTRAYLHEERVVREALEKAGFKVAREEMTGTNFYFSRLLEAKRV